MRCPNCSTELPDSAKFCLECGRDLRERSGFAAPASYTPKHLAERILTTRSALEGEHKQVTVLFCDIANSTGLADRVGPERMHALLNGFFEVALGEVHRYEGTVNQFLGDGFMALFGAPLAHEDDARRAVRAAVAIRRALRDRGSYMGGAELKVRMGLNTGLVVVGSIGDNLRMDYTAVGDTTNVAARLEQAATAGDILVSETTARLVRGDVRLTPTGALSVKGKSEPVTAYKVLGLAPTRTAYEHAAERALGRFHGRDSELRRLGERLAEARAGEGHVVLVVGEAGSGKSRLVYELRRTLGNDVTALEARCRSYGAAIPYLPILDLVRGQCGIAEIDAPDVAAGKLRTTLAGLGLDVDAQAPFLLRLLGIKDGTGGAFDDVALDVVHARTVDALRLMLIEGSRRRPILVVLEDMHWIDAASETYLGTLVAGLEEAPIMLLATHRPDWQPRWAMPEECVDRITLAPLSEADSVALVEDVVTRVRLPEALVQTILARASGNPLFLEELARAVALQADDAATPLTVPDTLRAVVSARLDRLSDAVKRVLQTAAVLGREFPQRLVEALWDGPGAVAAHLAELVRLDVVQELGGGDDPRYAFTNALTQEVAYESLLTATRESLHEKAALMLESGGAERQWERLAYHWTRTARADKAIEALRRVAARATAAYANAEAVAALREAESLVVRLDGEHDRIGLELALERAQAQFLLGDVPDVVGDLEARAATVERIADASLTAQYHFRLASARGMLGETARAIAHAERALAEAERAGDAVTAGRALYTLTRESFWSGEFRRGVDHGRRAIALLERTGDRWWLAMTHWMRALNYLSLGQFDEALDSAAWVASIADKLGDPRLASHAAWVGGWANTTRGDWAAGIAAGRRAVDLAPDEMGKALAESFLGIGYVEQGDADAALPHLEHATEVYQRFHFPQLEGWLTVCQAQAHLLRGDHARAEALVARGLEVVRGIRFAPPLVTARTVEAGIAQARGDLDGAERLLTDALALTEASEARYSGARLHLALAGVARARGDAAALVRHAGEARARFEALGAPVWTARAESLARDAGVTLAPR